MAREHMTEDGPRECNARSEADCPVKFGGTKAPHFNNPAEAAAFYSAHLESTNDAFVSFKRGVRRRKGSSGANGVPTTLEMPTAKVDVTALTREELVAYAASSSEACRAVGNEVDSRLRARRWEIDTLAALRPGSGSPVSEKTFKMLSEEVRLQRNQTYALLDAHMSSPHYRSSVRSEQAASPSASPTSETLWCRKMLDDHANANTADTFTYEPTCVNNGLVGTATLSNGSSATVEAYASASSDEWQGGPPQSVTNDALTRARERGASQVRVLAMIDGHQVREYVLPVN